MSEEQVVERIVDKDPKALKWFFLLFFMLLPLTGVLLFWFDGHARIEKEAVQFSQSTILPEMKAGGDLIDVSTPEMGDRIRAGEFEWIAEDLGKLKSYDRLDADQSRAREENDRGVIYVEVDFSGEYEKGSARVHLVITRLSMDTEWAISDLKMQVKE